MINKLSIGGGRDHSCLSTLPCSYKDFFVKWKCSSLTALPKAGTSQHLNGSGYLELTVILTTQKSFENTFRTWEW
jgi:hypothetical protein